MIRIEAVARLDALIEPFGGIATLIGDHAALARTGGRPRHGGAARERDLRFVAQRPEAHAGYVDGDIENQRTLGARTDDGLRLAFLAITFDDEARECTRQERQIVPAGNLLEQRE